MTSHPPAVSLNRLERIIDDLPDEVLEYILSLVPPYKDLQDCSLVCKRWLRSVKNVIRHSQKNLHRAMSEFNIMWEEITPTILYPTITKRYSHSAVCYGNSMYVFGGCSCTSTTFNDLWRLDLNKRQWVRPLTMGTYPSPKACASVVRYKETLVLFGGWTHPSPYPLHQAWKLFNELHMYNIVSNRWTCINTRPTPPAMAGHSATVQGETMVVFGGLHKFNYFGQYGSSNDVWCFNLEDQTWDKQTTTDVKPHPRYGQSQISLDENNVLIIGGCGGPNMVFSDVWLLSMTDSMWTWQEIPVLNKQWSPTHMWCHPACKVGQRVVVFSRNPVSNAPALPYTAQWNTPSQLRRSISNVWVPPREDDVNMDLARRTFEGGVDRKPVDRDQNVNGRRGTLPHRSSTKASPAASTSSSSGEESEPELAVAGPSGSNRSSKASPAVPGEFLSSRNSYSNLDSPELNSLGGMGMAAFRDPSPVQISGTTKNRQKQLESLRRMEEKLRGMSRNNNSSNSSGNNDIPQSRPGPSNAPTNEAPPEQPPETLSPTKTYTPKNAMTMFVLDISKVLSKKCYVEWLPLKNDSLVLGAPEEMILYTLVAGKGELIMFGGIQKDVTSITAQAQQLSSGVKKNSVSNSLYCISAPRGII